jgi:hypothetical protein
MIPYLETELNKKGRERLDQDGRNGEDLASAREHTRPVRKPDKRRGAQGPYPAYPGNDIAF